VGLSHLYQSYQLKEVTRVRRALRKRPTSVTLARQLRAAMKVARHHSRHETAMAVILSCDGDAMLDLMEAKKTGDLYYEKRREALKKDLKKAKVDAAILKGSVAAAIVPPAPQLQSRVEEAADTTTAETAEEAVAARLRPKTTAREGARGPGSRRPARNPPRTERLQCRPPASSVRQWATPRASVLATSDLVLVIVLFLVLTVGARRIFSNFEF
jgi:hypothetical protein